jgi:hypothetical protein
VQQPPEVRRTPVCALAIDEPAAGKELEDVVARLHDLALKRLPTAHDIPDALLRLGGNADRRQLARAIQARQVGGIALVMLPLDPGPLGNERGRDHVAGDAPLPQRPVQHVARTAGFITRAQLPVAGKAIEEPPEFRQVVWEAIEPCGRLGVCRQDGDRDRVLVDIHAEIDDTVG